MNPQILRGIRIGQDALVSMEGMVASLTEIRQPVRTRLSPSAIIAITMLVLTVLAVYQTYQRSMVTHDFLIIDDTEEVMTEDI